MYEDGKEFVYPDLSNRSVPTTVEYISNLVGVQFTADELVTLLSKMCLDAKIGAKPNELVVTIPPTRSDILHACDIMEDAAIAYNFNKIPKTFPKANTIAAPLPVNKLGDLLRRECAMAGFTECLPLILVFFILFLYI